MKNTQEQTTAGAPMSERRKSARNYLLSLPADAKIGDLYDNDAGLQTAMADAFDNFEYPDYSHQTVGNVLRKMDRIAAGLSFG